MYEWESIDVLSRAIVRRKKLWTMFYHSMFYHKVLCSTIALSTDYGRTQRLDFLFYPLLSIDYYYDKHFGTIITCRLIPQIRKKKNSFPFQINLIFHLSIYLIFFCYTFRILSHAVFLGLTLNRVIKSLKLDFLVNIEFFLYIVVAELRLGVAKFYEKNANFVSVL